MNQNDILGNTDRQQTFDTVLEETGKQAQEIPAVSDSPAKSGPVQENQVIQEFQNLLMENSPDKGQDYSMIMFQMDNMAGQLEAALHELEVVKQQLAEVQESPVKKVVSRVVSAVENRLHAIQECLSNMKDHIVENARQAVDGFKRTGISALDKAVSALHVKKGLEAVQRDLSESISDMKKSIGRIETIGHELRSVGGHIKNVGRVVTGKEQQLVDGDTEGRFQAVILAPLHMENKILSQLNNMALAAIGGVEHLEQAAGRESEQPDEAEPEKPAAREEKKPSVLKDLQEKKAQAAARPTPAPDKERKPQEAAL